jgi:hypothetical protein
MHSKSLYVTVLLAAAAVVNAAVAACGADK